MPRRGRGRALSSKAHQCSHGATLKTAAREPNPIAAAVTLWASSWTAEDIELECHRADQTLDERTDRGGARAHYHQLSRVFRTDPLNPALIGRAAPILRLPPHADCEPTRPQSAWI